MAEAEDDSDIALRCGASVHQNGKARDDGTVMMVTHVSAKGFLLTGLYPVHCLNLWALW